MTKKESVFQIDKDKERAAIHTILERAKETWPDIVNFVHNNFSEIIDFEKSKSGVYITGTLRIYIYDVKMDVTAPMVDISLSTTLSGFIDIDLERHTPTTLYVQYLETFTEKNIVTVPLLHEADGLHIEESTHLDEIIEIGTNRIEQYLKTF